MTEHNAKQLVTDFKKSLTGFNETLGRIQKQDDISETDYESLNDAQTKIAVATRAYLNDLNVDPKILRLLAPLMNGKQSFDQEQIIAFEKDFKDIVNNVREQLKNHDKDELLNKFPVLSDEKSIQSAEIKLEAIHNNFTAAANKSNNT